jgi:hypothetical protein
MMVVILAGPQAINTARSLKPRTTAELNRLILAELTLDGEASRSSQTITQLRLGLNPSAYSILCLCVESYATRQQRRYNNQKQLAHGISRISG